MRAAFLVGAQQLEMRTISDPVLPEDGLLLQVKACGVCGSDLRRWKEGITSGAEPMIPGHEVAGVVLATGGRVKNYLVGEKLAIAPDIHCGKCYYCQRGLFNLCDDLKFLGITPGYSGGFSENMILTGEVLENGIVHRIPDGMTFANAALAEPCSSVLAAHDKLKTSLEDTVVVMGAGPIGCLHVAVAHARGARVILSEPSLQRRLMAEKFQPDVIVDPSVEDIVSRVRQLTAGKGADLAICANPVAATQSQAVEFVRKAGKVVLFGGLPKAAPLTTMDANRIHYGEVMVVGSFSYHPSYHELALQVIQRGILPIDKLITHTYSLERTAEAFLIAASGDALKVMMINSDK